MAANAIAMNWVWSNRERLIARVRSARQAGPSVDTSRPIGDRVVPRAAGRPANPYEAAMADAGPAVPDAVRDHLADSTSRVRIDDLPDAR